jgi:hypothetical protein
MTLSMEDLQRRLLRRAVLLRAGLLLGSLLFSLILANMAASLFQVWELNIGAVIPDPWSTLLRVERVTQRSHLLSLIGTAFLAGASLSCLVFFLDRVIREGWGWLRDLLRR